MLNISNNKVDAEKALKGYNAFEKLFNKSYYKNFNKFLLVFAVVGVIFLFLPWTQNVTGNGYLTTLTPGQRPQTIQSPIPGRIEQWYVREGDYVEKGDTIIFISEIKNEYLDPRLVERTLAQRDAKSRSVNSYGNKVTALGNQIQALNRERVLKIQQTENKLKQDRFKVISDSIDLEAVRNNTKIAQTQYERALILNKEGLKPLSDVEAKRLKLQQMNAKQISQENKLLTSKNKVINAIVEISRTSASFADKIAKAQSDRSTAESNQYDAEAQVSKLNTQSANYQLRNNMYYIKAPQNGYINKALKTGIGETFKEGEQLVGIMPAEYDLAVETFVEPIDLPLIHLGEEVRIQFDGWPAIFFSGWPNASFGTYAGEVVAVETFISQNGKFRILIAPSSKEKNHDWPKNIRVGSGAYTIALLEDVPVWYEIWRRLNGFPANYYTPEGKEVKSSKSKKK